MKENISRKLADTGASVNVANPEFLEKLQHRLEKRWTTTRLKLGNGQVASASQIVSLRVLSPKGTIYKMDFVILPNLPFDAILGFPAMKFMKVVINFDSETLTLQNGSVLDLTVQQKPLMQNKEAVFADTDINIPPMTYVQIPARGRPPVETVFNYNILVTSSGSNLPIDVRCMHSLHTIAQTEDSFLVTLANFSNTAVQVRKGKRIGCLELLNGFKLTSDYISYVKLSDKVRDMAQNLYSVRKENILDMTRSTQEIHELHAAGFNGTSNNTLYREAPLPVSPEQTLLLYDPFNMDAKLRELTFRKLSAICVVDTKTLPQAMLLTRNPVIPLPPNSSNIPQELYLVHCDGNLSSNLEVPVNAEEKILYDSLWKKVEHLPRCRRNEAMTLLWQYRDIFPKKQFPATVTPASFTVSGNPVQLSGYRSGFQERTKLREIIQSMLDSNEIRPSNSPWSSPCLLTQKPSGGWRFVVDYRQLNKRID